MAGGTTPSANACPARRRGVTAPPTVSTHTHPRPGAGTIPAVALARHGSPRGRSPEFEGSLRRRARLIACLLHLELSQRIAVELRGRRRVHRGLRPGRRKHLACLAMVILPGLRDLGAGTRSACKVELGGLGLWDGHIPPGIALDIEHRRVVVAVLGRRGEHIRLDQVREWRKLVGHDCHRLEIVAVATGGRHRRGTFDPDILTRPDLNPRRDHYGSGRLTRAHARGAPTRAPSARGYCGTFARSIVRDEQVGLRFPTVVRHARRSGRDQRPRPCRQARSSESSGGQPPCQVWKQGSHTTWHSVFPRRLTLERSPGGIADPDGSHTSQQTTVQ